MRRLVLTLSILGCALAALPAVGHAKTVWLCKPGQSPDPCSGDLTTSFVDPNGNVVRTEQTPLADKPAYDCFYVYPTVSSQKTINANLHVDPEETAIAQFQAQRFSQDCQVYAPMYRQVTIQALLNPKLITAKKRAIAYRSAVAGWHDYLRRYNNGRGVVLIGHSQGTFVLRQLITDEIDKKPAERRLLVSALLLGGNVLRGEWKHVPACRSSTQLGCVVAYSMFNATPPKKSLFGRAPKGKRVLCTNPAALGGGSGVLRTYGFNAPFPGLLGIEVNVFVGPLPQVSTPWIGAPGTYTAKCSTAGGANVLLVKASDGARDFRPMPDATWGWHLGDVSVALGNLTELVAAQGMVWARTHRG